MTNILTREFTIAEIIDFLKAHFTNDRYANTLMDLSLDENAVYELPEINAILADFDIDLKLEELSCELPELNFISLAA